MPLTKGARSSVFSQKHFFKPADIIAAIFDGIGIDKAFVKLKFNDFTTTTVERVGTKAVEADYQDLLAEGWERKAKPVRLIGLGVRLIDDGDHVSERLPFSDTPLSENDTTA